MSPGIINAGCVRTLRLVGCAAICTVFAAGRTEGQPALPHQIQTIALAGVEGRIDHMTFDALHHRLFVAALENNTVEVVDVKEGRRVKSLRGFHEPQGVAYVGDANRLYVANAGGTCEILDATTFQKMAQISLQDDADNIRIDSKSSRVYVGYGGGVIGVVDAGSGKRLGDIRLSAHPEGFQLEATGPRIFVNVPGAGQIAVIDRRTNQVTALWPVVGARANYPMALDESGHRLFIGCRDPARVLVYESGSGKQTGVMTVAGDTDDLFYDNVRKRLYVSCGAGSLEVLKQNSSGGFDSEARIPTARGARTSLYVPEVNRLYVAVPHRGAQQAEIRVYEVGR